MKLSDNAPTERLKEMLGELGIDNCYDNYDHGMLEWHVDGIKFAAANAWNVNDPSGTCMVLHVMYPNPEWVAQAISKLLKDAPVDRDNKRLKTEIVKLRELSVRMARALGVKSGWCTADCAREFGCAGMDECPIEVALRELGLDVYKRAKSKEQS